LGILLFTRHLENFLHNKTGNRFWSNERQETLRKQFIRKLGAGTITLLSVGFAAWLGCAGILLYHFYRITPLSSLWTVVVFPAVAVILTIGFLKIILTLLLPSVGAILGMAVTYLAGLLIGLVKFISSLGISEILTGHVPAGFVVCYYFFVLFAAVAYFRRPLIKNAVCTAAIVGLIGFLGVTKWQRSNRDCAAVNCLAVGHGQAIQAELPGGANVLFDAGSVTTNDCGTRIVVPFLDFKGLSKIDAILISHDDVDHINGIPEIARVRKICNVYTNSAFLNKVNDSETAKTLQQYLTRHSLDIQPADKTIPIAGSAKIELLWPDEQVWPIEGLSDNDTSLVTLIEFAGRKILLCSDIEKFAQTKLLETYPDLKADIVVAPHHGSAKTLAEGFLEKLEPSILIFSCSRRDYQRYAARPGGAPQTQNNAFGDLSNNIQCFYTARDGAVTIRIEKDGTIKRFLNRR